MLSNVIVSQRTPLFVQRQNVCEVSLLGRGLVSIHLIVRTTEWIWEPLELFVWLPHSEWASVSPAQHPLQQINLYHRSTRLPPTTGEAVYKTDRQWAAGVPADQLKSDSLTIRFTVVLIHNRKLTDHQTVTVIIRYKISNWPNHIFPYIRPWDSYSVKT